MKERCVGEGKGEGDESAGAGDFLSEGGNQAEKSSSRRARCLSWLGEE